MSAALKWVRSMPSKIVPRLLLLSTVLMLGLSAASCVGPNAGVTGNDTGGIVPWSPENDRHAGEIADQHCAGYNKYGRVTSKVRQPGHYIAWSCTWKLPYGRALRTRG
jgi:hypothetical protein